MRRRPKSRCRRTCHPPATSKLKISGSIDGHWSLRRNKIIVNTQNQVLLDMRWVILSSMTNYNVCNFAKYNYNFVKLCSPCCIANIDSDSEIRSRVRLDALQMQIGGGYISRAYFVITFFCVVSRQCHLILIEHFGILN